MAWSPVDTAETVKYMYVGQVRESFAQAVRVCVVPSARVTVRYVSFVVRNFCKVRAQGTRTPTERRKAIVRDTMRRRRMRVLRR